MHHRFLLYFLETRRVEMGVNAGLKYMLLLRGSIRTSFLVMVFYVCIYGVLTDPLRSRQRSILYIKLSNSTLNIMLHYALHVPVVEVFKVKLNIK